MVDDDDGGDNDNRAAGDTMAMADQRKESKRRPGNRRSSSDRQLAAASPPVTEPEPNGLYPSTDPSPTSVLEYRDVAEGSSTPVLKKAAPARSLVRAESIRSLKRSSSSRALQKGESYVEGREGFLKKSSSSQSLTRLAAPADTTTTTTTTSLKKPDSYRTLKQVESSAAANHALKRSGSSGSLQQPASISSSTTPKRRGSSTGLVKRTGSSSSLKPESFLKQPEPSKPTTTTTTSTLKRRGSSGSLKPPSSSGNLKRPGTSRGVQKSSSARALMTSTYSVPSKSSSSKSKPVASSIPNKAPAEPQPKQEDLWSSSTSLNLEDTLLKDRMHHRKSSKHSTKKSTTKQPDAEGSMTDLFQSSKTMDNTTTCSSLLIRGEDSLCKSPSRKTQKKKKRGSMELSSSSLPSVMQKQDRILHGSTLSLMPHDCDLGMLEDSCTIHQEEDLPPRQHTKNHPTTPKSKPKKKRGSMVGCDEDDATERSAADEDIFPVKSKKSTSQYSSQGEDHDVTEATADMTEFSTSIGESSWRQVWGMDDIKSSPKKVPKKKRGSMTLPSHESTRSLILEDLDELDVIEPSEIATESMLDVLNKSRSYEDKKKKKRGSISMHESSQSMLHESYQSLLVEASSCVLPKVRPRLDDQKKKKRGSMTVTRSQGSPRNLVVDMDTTKSTEVANEGKKKKRGSMSMPPSEGSSRNLTVELDTTNPSEIAPDEKPQLKEGTKKKRGSMTMPPAQRSARNLTRNASAHVEKMAFEATEEDEVMRQLNDNISSASASTVSSMTLSSSSQWLHGTEDKSFAPRMTKTNKKQVTTANHFDMCPGRERRNSTASHGRDDTTPKLIFPRSASCLGSTTNSGQQSCTSLPDKERYLMESEREYEVSERVVGRVNQVFKECSNQTAEEQKLLRSKITDDFKEWKEHAFFFGPFMERRFRQPEHENGMVINGYLKGREEEPKAKPIL